MPLTLSKEVTIRHAIERGNKDLSKVKVGRAEVEKALENGDLEGLWMVCGCIILMDERSYYHPYIGAREIFQQDESDLIQVVDVNYIAASPVLMALYLGRYDLVKPLVEAGHPLLVTYTNYALDTLHHREYEGYLFYRDYISNEYVDKKFTIGQYVMGDPHMPDELRLYLWTAMAGQIHRNKQEKAKTNHLSWEEKLLNPPIEFSYFTFLEETDLGVSFFGQDEYINTFISSLKLFGRRRRRYFAETPDNGWAGILNMEVKKVALEALKIMVAEGFGSHGNYRRWTVEKYLTRDYEFHPTDSLETAVYLEPWELDKYVELKDLCYKAGLEYQYVTLLIKRYIDTKTYIGNIKQNMSAKNFNKLKHPTLHRLKDMIKEVIPNDMSFGDFAYRTCGENWGSYSLCFIIDICDSAMIMDAYKEITNLPVIIDDHSISNLPNRQTYLRDDDCDDEVYELKLGKVDWLERVDRFCLKRGIELNHLQRSILKQDSHDILALALRKGLYEGSYADLAIEFCIKNERYMGKIPCIVAYSS